jgi:hypothetical protein
VSTLDYAHRAKNIRNRPEVGGAAQWKGGAARGAGAGTYGMACDFASLHQPRPPRTHIQPAHLPTCPPAHPLTHPPTHPPHPTPTHAPPSKPTPTPGQPAHQQDHHDQGADHRDRAPQAGPCRNAREERHLHLQRAVGRGGRGRGCVAPSRRALVAALGAVPPRTLAPARLRPRLGAPPFSQRCSPQPQPHPPGTSSTSSSARSCGR